MNGKENYTHYQAEDFLKDSYFLAWMRNEDKQVNAFWEQWQTEHPDKKGVINEAVHRYQAFISFDKTGNPGEEEQEVWEGIKFYIEKHSGKNILRKRLWGWAAAAVVTLLLAAGWFHHRQICKKKECFVVVQTGDEQKELILSDSSEIFLNSHTTLKYRPNNGREFWLEGQAYFNIKHKSTEEDAAIPFTVHAGVESIAVLGTSFTVKSIDSTARVVLINGKVKASVDKTSLIIKPGEKVIWKKNEFTSVRVNPRLYLAWKEGEFHFDHTSLKDLKVLIRDYYGYDLVVRNKTALKIKTISGTVSSKDEAVLWKMLGVMFHAKVMKKGEHIILEIKN